MAENSNIEWCDHTFNPWIGCTKVGPGCDHCYAESMMDTRLGTVNWGSGNPRKRTSESNWKLPLKWNRQDEKEGKRYRVFCASLADVFDNEVPQDWRNDLFDLIFQTPNLDWLLLTKRIGNARKIIDVSTFDGSIPENVWLGATVVNQEEAARDIPKLLQIPAEVRFLSMEPLLEHINLTHLDVDQHSDWCQINALTGKHTDMGRPCPDVPSIDWVIAGGESGPHARPMQADWVRSIRDQCAAAGVPFLFKQWGEWAPEEEIADAKELDISSPPSLLDREVYTNCEQHLYRVGKKKAGRTLDGVTHTEFP